MKKHLRHPNRIYDRIRKIIEIARGNIVHAVNAEMVIAYWHIGKEIVEAEQRGISRAVYGKKLIENLSKQLIEKYGTGWSASHLWHVRQFYLLYKDRMPSNLRTRGAALEGKILHTLRAELSWSHYRILMRIEKLEARAFYEIECIKNNWSVRELERQKGSLLDVC